MATPNRNPAQTKYSEQYIANTSYDEDFGVQTFEMLGYDPLANAMKRVTTNALGEYGTNDVVESGTIQYVGKEDAAGDWFIQKVDTASGTVVRYATVKNNASYTTYTNAWTDRASLTYGTYGTAF